MTAPLWGAAGTSPEGYSLLFVSISAPRPVRKPPEAVRTRVPSLYADV